MNSKIVKSYSVSTTQFWRILVWTLLPGFLLVSALRGQQESNEDSPTYELSPFVVSAGDSVGYQASSTLAGSRVRTPLKDLGAAISIITPEFLEDTGATDAGTLLSYTINSETGGVNGNFSGVNASGNGRFTEDDQRVNPQQNQRIRGLGRAELTRGYFLTNIAFDSYNTDRVTVSRGPNSLLFGIGSPGGVINNGLKQPVYGGDFGELSVRIGERGSYRTTLDINEEIIDDRLAVRIAGLYDDYEYNQRPAFERDRRTYAALNAVLLKNEESRFFDSTVLRINGEKGESEGLPPNIVPPSQSWTNWFEPWNPAYEVITGVQAPPQVRSSDGGTWESKELVNGWTTTLESNMNTVTNPFIFRRQSVVFSDPNSQVPNLGLTGIHPATGEDLSEIQGFLGLYPMRSGDSIESLGLAGTAAAATITDLPNDFRYWHTNSPFAENFAPGFIVPTLLSTDIFDFRNRLFSGDTERVEREFDAGTVTLEQTFLDNQFGLEFAYDSQSYETNKDFLFTGGSSTTGTGAYDVSVDVNEFLSNGMPNPNIGRAMVRVSGTQRNVDFIDREAGRVTGFATVDFRDMLDEESWLTKLLGHHRFTGMYNEQQIDTFTRQNRRPWDSNFENTQTILNARFHQARRWENVTVYVSDPLFNISNPNDIRLQGINIRKPQVGDVAKLITYDFGQPEGARQIHNGDFEIREAAVNEDIGRRKIESKAVSWQSYLLGENIVGLVGWRTDESKDFERLRDPNVEDRLFTGAWNPAATVLDQEPSFVEDGDTVTWSVVGKYPVDILPKLPFGMDLQVHYGESENFNPTGLRRTFYGDLIAQPGADTKEYGFTLSTDDGRFVARMNWFESNVLRAPAGLTNGVDDDFNEWLEDFRREEFEGTPFDGARKFLNDPSESPIFTYEQFYDAVFQAIPDRVRNIWNFRFEDRDNDGFAEEVVYDEIPNESSTTQRSAEGFELDFVANVTKEWRLMLNVSQQETVQTDTALELQEITAEVLDSIRSLGLAPLVQSPSPASVTTIEGEITTETLLPLRRAVSRDGTVQLEQREWRVNAITNYTFAEGVLKGFGVGGAIRWQDKAAIGYPLRFEDGVQLPDLSRPFFDDGLVAGDIWFSYGRELFNERIDWKIQLNVKNVVGDNDELIPIAAQPTGDVAAVRIPNEKEFFLTNTFRF